MDVIFHAEGKERVTRSLRVITKDFRGLGHLVRDSGVQVVFSCHFQLKAAILKETDGSPAGVTTVILGVLTMEWPVQCQECWHQVALTFLSEGRESLPGN